MLEEVWGEGVGWDRGYETKSVQVCWKRCGVRMWGGIEGMR